MEKLMEVIKKGNIKYTMISTMAIIVTAVASMSSSSCSFFWTHQPKVPAELLDR